MSRVFVTGMGIISPLGDTVELNREALKAGECGIGRVNKFPSRYSGILPFGEIDISNDALADRLDAHEHGITRTALLAMHAIDQAIADSGLTREQVSSYDTALIGGTTVGGMCLTDELYHDANKVDEGSEFLSSYDSGSTVMFLQKRYGSMGITNAINTACSSSANAIMHGARLMQNGLAKRAIVGGMDCLAKFTINGFNALHILSGRVCRPFDRDRNGLNLGEGAGFIILEREEDLNGKKVYAELAGWCNANDAFHPSSLSDNGDGPYLAMTGALKVAGLKPSDIGFVNTHGTGTENNDEVETRAMVRVFGTPPPFASTKSNIGHTLGAAGGIEAIYSILNLHYQEIYKSLHAEHAIESTRLLPVMEYAQTNVEAVMSNSFGFGGNCSSIIFSKA